MEGLQLQKNPTILLLVVAAAIRRSDGSLLLQQRPAGKRHGGLWEFPGGKVESGEVPMQALQREIVEELAITIDIAALQPAGFAETAAESGHPALLLILYTADSWSGAVTPCEGQAWGWFTPAEAERLALAPMDRALLKKLTDQGLPS
ncbi:NUDIX domain-containing protein [Altererythrobacter xixiisoli]|uniref:8-oxo-dGTP diphosphatase n=2 Tax=Croceibacterium xixiisoli TaxID=1476466 RepID=A0A6I4TVI7_9SPHN|nr:NUDIX domain-containing protein [Croceibacterium xixiisoli]